MGGRLPFEVGVYILGINSAYHESSAALVKDGVLIAAAEEERFNRIKHAKRARPDTPHLLPIEAIEYCLSEAGIRFSDIDYVGYSFNPLRRLEANIGVDDDVDAGNWGSKEGERLFYSLLVSIPKKLEALYDVDLSGRFHWIDHHLCHAASAFLVSPFERAAVISIDGIGEFDTVWLGKGEGNRLRQIGGHQYPHSLGFLWERVSKFLGFGEYGVWKVMGMHAFGDPGVYARQFRKFVTYDDRGTFLVDNRITRFRQEESLPFHEIFGPPRREGDPVEQRHMDLAAALQQVTNETMLSLARHVKKETGADRLCMAGGVALNCVANGILHREGLFRDIFVQPAAHDAGTALGAAFYVWNVLLGRTERFVMEHAFYGPDFTDARIRNDLEFNGLRYERVADIAERVARLVAEGKIVAWFQGRMEFGPRALGNRSILADPRNAALVGELNAKVKHREYFRPFAPSVLTEKYDAWFEGGGVTTAPFMLHRAAVRPERRGEVPAVTHVDGSSRPQVVAQATNPLYHRMIGAFERISGVPMVLNTSFNDREPIICCPEDAIMTCIKSRLDALAIGEYLAEIV